MYDGELGDLDGIGDLVKLDIRDHGSNRELGTPRSRWHAICSVVSCRLRRVPLSFSQLLSIVISCQWWPLVLSVCPKGRGSLQIISGSFLATATNATEKKTRGASQTRTCFLWRFCDTPIRSDTIATTRFIARISTALSDALTRRTYSYHVSGKVPSNRLSLCICTARTSPSRVDIVNGSPVGACHVWCEPTCRISRQSFSFRTEWTTLYLMIFAIGDVGSWIGGRVVLQWEMPRGMTLRDQV